MLAAFGNGLTQGYGTERFSPEALLILFMLTLGVAIALAATARSRAGMDEIDPSRPPWRIRHPLVDFLVFTLPLGMTIGLLIGAGFALGASGFGVEANWLKATIVSFGTALTATVAYLCVRRYVQRTGRFARVAVGMLVAIGTPVLVYVGVFSLDVVLTRDAARDIVSTGVASVLTLLVISGNFNLQASSYSASVRRAE
jgi:hypothetical protein